MANKWIVGLLMLWIILTILANTAEQSALLGTGETSTLMAFMRPPGTNFDNPISGIYSIITDMWHYFKLIIKVVILWYPVLWQGMGMYIYPFFLAVSISFVISVVVALRGGSSS